MTAERRRGRYRPARWDVWLLTIALSWNGALAASGPKPLFASEDILKLRIEAPFDDLVRAAPTSTKPYEAKLILLEPNPEVYSIYLSARGVSRRSPSYCEFPPLRIEFREKPAGLSPFRGQKTLKLATHCRRLVEFQNFNLLEYAAYKLLNKMTPVSFRVRLADIDYVESRTGNVRIHRLGFLIEDVDELAARNGLQEIKAEKIERAQLDAGAVARSDLFQYMIGNQDWSDRFPSAGRACCHNMKLLGVSSSDPRNLIPVAYDFDSSGFVDAPYALPPVGMPISSVRVRSYRGLCQFNDQASAAAHDLFAKRSELMTSVLGTPDLSERSKEGARAYLEEFFHEISDPDQMKRHLLDKCRY